MSIKEKRQLKAIAFADIVGYTAMMEANEQEALLHLNRFREALEREAPAYDGRIVQYYGDGALLVFDSSIDALRCAMRLQGLFQESSPAIPVRIGIHSGDIVEQGGNIFGDSVNLASRIESCGIPGAVLFSGRVARDLKGHPEFRIAPLGRLAFKNIDEIQAVFAIANDGFPVPRWRELHGKLKRRRNWLPASMRWLAVVLLLVIGAWLAFQYMGRPRTPLLGTPNVDHSVAVLPFRWLSASSSDDYFAEGIAEAIRGKLAQIGGLRVTSMTSALRYIDSSLPIQDIASELRVSNLLEGSILREGDRLQVNVRLVEAQTDRQLWVRSFDEQVTDIFSIQNRVANEVARAMAATLSRDERRRLDFLATQNVEAYEHFLAGRRNLFHAIQSQDSALINRARASFRQAIRLDPNYAQPYVGLAEALISTPVGPAQAANLDSAMQFSRRALALDPANDKAYAILGQIAWWRRDLEGAAAHYWRALELAPSNTNALMGYSQVLMAERKFDLAIPKMVRALALDPRNQRDPNNKELYNQLAEIYLEAHRYKEAEKMIERALELFPGDELLLRQYRRLLLTTGEFDKAVDIAKILLERSFNLVDLDQLALSNLFAGRYAEAERLYRQLYQMQTDTLRGIAILPTFRHRLAFALWKQGRRDEARHLVEEHLADEKAIIADGTRYRGQEYDIAAAYAFTGKREAAYEWLERMPYWTVTYRLLRVDPLFDELRREARFKRILAEKEKEVRKIQKALEEAELQEDAFRQLWD